MSQNKLQNRLYRKYNSISRFTIIASVLGLLAFILLVQFAPFGRQLLNTLYPKLISQAVIGSDNQLEPEVGLITGSASVVLDSSASNGSYIHIGVLTQPPPSGGFLPAFPGALGFGARAWQNCDRTQLRVIEVTNLNVSGSGSFLAAITASGPRIVVFKVGGTIDSSTASSPPREMRVTTPCLYIAGQTAPGDGIMLKGITLNINTHDAIIRGLRVRVGDQFPSSDVSRDAIQLETDSSNRTTGIYNVIVDHNSVSWATDENMSTWTGDVGNVGSDFGPIRDVTFSWNLISEGLYCSIHNEGCHSKGLLIGDHSKNVSVLGNLFIHNSDRSPEIKGDVSIEVINNVVYNYRDGGGITGGTLIGDWEGLGTFVNQANVLGNYYQPGFDWTNIKGIGFTDRIANASRIYVSGNIGPGRPTDSGDDWLAVDQTTSLDYASYAGLRAPAPALTPSGAVALPVLIARDRVLQNAGAIAPARDIVDTRVVTDAINGTCSSCSPNAKTGTGRIINSQTQVGGWPVMNNGTPPVDTDHDGMPDSWESARGLNPNLNDAALDRNSDGYANIEEYVNGLINQL